jgi:hypothetical protein
VASVIMSYAFDIPEAHTTEEENVGDVGDDLVSDDEDDKTVLSMIPLADMLCVYPCSVHGPITFRSIFASLDLHLILFISCLEFCVDSFWQERRCRQE